MTFVIVVDDFGIKFTNLKDAEYLIETLKKKHEITIDWNGSRYAGITLNWDYKKRTIDILMLNYIQKALQRFHVKLPSKPVHAPHIFTENKLNDQTPVTKEEPTLPPKEINLAQQIIGVLLFYARAVDVRLTETSQDLSTRQTKATRSLMNDLTKLTTMPCHPSRRHHATRIKQNDSPHRHRCIMSQSTQCSK